MALNKIISSQLGDNLCNSFETPLYLTTPPVTRLQPNSLRENRLDKLNTKCKDYLLLRVSGVLLVQQCHLYLLLADVRPFSFSVLVLWQYLFYDWIYRQLQ